MFDSSNTSSNIHTDTAQVTPSTPGKHNSTQLNTQLSNTECPFLSRLVIGQYSRRIILYSRGEASSTCMYAYNRVCMIPWLTLDSRRVTRFDSFMVRCIRKGKPISVWYWWWRISVNGAFRYFLHSISTWKMYIVKMVRLQIWWGWDRRPLTTPSFWENKHLNAKPPLLKHNTCVHLPHLNLQSR